MDLSKIINKNVANIEPDIITKFSGQISGIPDLIYLTLGEPDFNTPEHIKKAAIQAINDNDSHYSNPQGIEKLRKAAANFMATKYDVHYDPQTEILATTGVNEAILDTFIALLQPGDEIIIPTPAFPVYQGIVEMLGAKSDFLNTSDDGFKVTPEKLEQALNDNPNAHVVLLNFPSNPTGQTYTKDELQALSKVLKQHDVVVISDEIYSELTYGQTHESLGKLLPDRTVVFNGLSKSHAMTGWRLGMVFAPQEILTEIAKVHINNTFNVPLIVQVAGYEAFQNGMDDALPMKKEYEKRQDLVISGLKEAGIEADKPHGAFYIFAKIPDSYQHDSVKFCTDLAEQAHVGVVPGVGFGPGGEDYFRISYATSLSNLKEALKRIKQFMDKQ